MALIDEVTAYYSTEELVKWTNPSSRAASSINTTNLQEACDDTEAWFEIYSAGVSYDNSNRKHLVLAREGVLLQLKRKAGIVNQALREDLQAWQETVRDLAKTDGLNRLSPEVDSYTDVSDDVNAKRPRFDRKKFRGVRPR